MTLRLFNTQTDRKEDLVPQVPGEVSLYVCGPTVYDMSHVGHARCYVAWDVVVRYLRFSGLKVTYVRNVTDVDDKIINRAAKLNESPLTLSRRFEEEYNRDMASLGCGLPDVTPHVTDHIPEIISLIERLIGQGNAYESRGDVYFAVRQYPEYGKLSHRNIDDLLAGARVEPGDQKRDPLDFALWKAAKPGEISWDSPWGKGRPGWHIECSAMSMKYLGETFDLHAGGKDLVFPHHENELAQSEAATHRVFARQWMHNGFVVIKNESGEDEKMAKSGTFSTIRQALETVDGQAMRLFLLSTHYRAPIQFSEAAVHDAQRRVEYIYETIAKADAKLGPNPDRSPGELLEPARVEALLTGFRTAMDDDFNTAEALGLVSPYLTWINELCDKAPAGAAKTTVRRTIARLRADLETILSVLAVGQDPPHQGLERIRALNARRRNIDCGWVDGLIAQRIEARKAKDFARADGIRQELATRGVEIMDTPQGTTWRVV
jgi:cysteinyl-tRNA synthetase